MTPKCPDCRHDQDGCICIPFEVQIRKLTEERDALKSALVGLVKVAPVEVSCNDMSHPRKYQHAYDQTCELVSMYAEALLTAQESLKGLK